MRISGINLPENKRLEIALTAVYGVGRPRAIKIIEKCGLDVGMKTTALTADEENLIRREIELFKTEGDLKRETQQHIKRLKDIKAYRGVRHIKHLPARGQRTKTNSRTVRGNVRRTMGSGRRKTEKT
ncbi:30S ribosomal protein S13 [Candidatus Gracilibacteria bacterium]|nr:30S ribosomal protein S13 [Candidatus Gracilibacteria bacterium]MCF7898405.1 30S ribosomal protein S13 [Candidatus Paceibacterota bacterium]